MFIVFISYYDIFSVFHFYTDFLNLNFEICVDLIFGNYLSHVVQVNKLVKKIQTFLAFYFQLNVFFKY